MSDGYLYCKIVTGLLTLHFFFMRVMTHAIGQTVKPNFTTGIKFAVEVGIFGLLAIPFFVRALIAQATKQCQPQDFP